MNVLAPAHPPFTSAEFYKMAARGAFAGFRVELRRGAIVKMSPKHIPHASVQADLMFALKSAIEQAGLAWRVFTEATVSFGGGFEPMPDIVVVDAALLPSGDKVIPSAAVKLIVEVADSSVDDDMGEKREDYAAAGVAEYWVADVNARQVVRHANPANSAFGTVVPTPLAAPLAMLTAPAVIAQVK